ncbi:MAG TPA: ATP-binding protein [Sphingobacteriaceae bacterium]|nr:ATP-binding protein [Sphingobacteriaceae bacterium]
MNSSKRPQTEDPSVPQFLSGGGEMGKLIRSKDWSKTPLGSPDNWPQSLRTTVSLCLASNFPISIAWGLHRVQIYNDGYLPITGGMHPTSMGQDFKECWISAWPVIGQAFEEASLGQTRFLENQRVFVDRYGYKEEAFFTFSFSPILDESGGVGGLFHPVIEMTQQTLAERRLNILRAVADNTVNARTADEAFTLILECLKAFDLDLPFVLLYSIAANGKEANLKGRVGVEMDTPIAPAKINLEEHSSKSWPFTEVIQNRKAVHVEELGEIFGAFDCGPYTERPEQALVFPVTLHGTAQNNYLLVAGVSSRRSLDEKYRVFFDLLTASITNALTKVRAQEDERKKSEALAEIDKAKTVFFSNISHEFRTPLTLMLGSLEELLNKPNGEIAFSDKEAIETSHRNAMRLLRLVNNLLDFSRIEAGKVQAQYQLTDLAKYTTELASNFRSVVEAAGLLFQVKTDTLIQPVYIDKEMWEKIVLNLLSNAFKYTLNGSITISLTTENNQVLLKVKDTGVGIPEAELPKMFQRFHRVQNVVGRTYEGTGIGLSLVSELVKLHGGEIKVQSKEAEGSVFTVSIPTGKAHLPTQHVFEKELDFTASLSDAFIEEATTLIDHKVLTVSGKESFEGHTDAATVLVVDDNADMRAYIKNLLQKQYHVVTANNGKDALHQVKKHSPKLILSDIMMPVMDGIQLLKAVKENIQTQNIPVILLSARAGEESKIEGYETGADDYLVKPFSAKELLARVASQLKLVNLRQATETNVRNLFMQAPAAIGVLRGPQHIYELTNAMYKQLIGNRDVVGKPIRQALPELEGTGIYELLDKVYTTGEPFIANKMPVTLQKENGVLEECILNYTCQASRNETGEINGILVHGVDVTEQVTATQQIEASEKQFRTFADSIQNLAWIANADGWIYWYNQRWYDYTGTTLEDIQGWGWDKVHHPDHIEKVVAFVREAWKKDEAFELTFPMRRHDGEYRWFLTRAYPVKDVIGNIEKWIGTNTDIHYQKTAEQKKDQFISIASHELKTPLTAAKGYLDLLKLTLKEKSGPASLFAGKASDALNRLHNLIKELLDVSVIENGKLDYTVSAFDFNEMMNETIEGIQFVAKNHHIKKFGDLLHQVRGDKYRLQQVIVNLLTNAIKYSPNAKEVLVYVEEKDNMVQVAVKDFGIGMSKQHLDKVFDRYYRVHENALQFQGLGIGLFISYEIIGRHEGRIWVESEPGIGSTFCFKIPL